jgi:hypothetical protein
MAMFNNKRTRGKSILNPFFENLPFGNQTWLGKPLAMEILPGKATLNGGFSIGR